MKFASLAILLLAAGCFSVAMGACDSSCGAFPYQGTGACFETGPYAGKCQCKTGWTGASLESSRYVPDLNNPGKFIIISDNNCSTGCDDNAFLNPLCAILPAGCNQQCGAFNTGTCQVAGSFRGRCLCAPNWSGPNAFFTDSTNTTLYADFCTEACNYDTSNVPGLDCLRFKSPTIRLPIV